MTKNMNPRTASDALAANVAEARALLAALTAAIEAEAANPEPNWGDAGSMGHVVEQLRNAAAHYGAAS